MSFKEALKIQFKEYKEQAKNPWFWVFYVITLFLLYHFRVLG